ncbi:MAG: aminopeptidase [Bacteroidales bacterium]|jgi:hypothetical protein|nr:aminopeptidase [Bacteroidales bacterium]
MKKAPGFFTLRILSIIFFLTGTANAFSQQQSELINKIKTYSAEYNQTVKEIKPLPLDTRLKKIFSEKYELEFEQPVNHSDPSMGTFYQDIHILHAGFDRPTVLITEGYSANYASNPRYLIELAYILKANIIVVEHRYFNKSIPFKQKDTSIRLKDLNWEYMNAVQESADLHSVNYFFRQIYGKGKWIASGTSKGGETTMFYTSYYPKDMDFSVPYVGPVCDKVEDPRQERFIEHETGTPEARKKVYEFQKEVLERRKAIEPMMQEWMDTHGQCKFRIGADELLDYTVLEFSYSFWQMGRHAPETIPDPAKASDRQMFDYLVSVDSPDYFSVDPKQYAFFVQASKELGYYKYDTKPFRGLLSIKSSKNYLRHIFIYNKFKFDKYLTRRINNFMDTTSNKILFVYGGYDPWGSVKPRAAIKNEKAALKGRRRNNMYLFVNPGGSHGSKILKMPEPLKNKALTVIKEWMSE